MSDEIGRYGCGSDYGRLREVIVGIPDALTLPPFSADLCHYNDELRGVLESSGGKPVSIRDAMPERYERAAAQIETIAATYEERGVVAHRPRPFSGPERRYLGDLQTGHSQLYPADPVYMLGAHFLELNIELSRDWPVITEMKDPPEDADEWREVKDKLQYLER